MLGHSALLRSALRTSARRAKLWALRTWRDPAKRERAHAAAAFTLIFAFTLGSIDYLITGGPDWNPGGEAYAMELAQPQAPRAAAAPLGAEAALPPALIVSGEFDYSFTTEELLGGPEPIAGDPFGDTPAQEAADKTAGGWAPSSFVSKSGADD